MSNTKIYAITDNQMLVPINVDNSDISIGTYVGDGASSKTVSVDKEIKFGVIYAVGEPLSQTITANGDCWVYAGMMSQSGCSADISLVDGGFQVKQDASSPMDGKRGMLNQSGKSYIYAIWSASKPEIEPPIQDAYTKTESDARYAPIAAAIRPTVTGEIISVNDSVEWPLQGLTLYGKSTQDGTPTPEAPIPIVSAGDSGTITVTVSDGAEQSQTLPISTPTGLHGIPVSSGGNYTDADGQQWVCDEVDFARGKYVQRFKMLEFDGTEDWRGAATNVSENIRFFLTGTGIRNMKNNFEIIRGLSTHYTTKSPEQTFAKSTGISASMYIANFDGAALYVYDKNHNTTVEDWKSYLAAQKAAGTPVKVVYELETPVETNIPEETIEAYKSLTTYSPVTNIMTDSTPSAGLSVRYVADAQKYIDNKLSTINTQLLEVKTNV